MSELPKAEKLARAWDKVMSGGRSFDSGLIAQTKKELRSLEAALAAKDAETSAAVAAALEEACAGIKRHSDVARTKMAVAKTRGEQDIWSAIASHIDIERDAIRALITPDATDALERDRARVRRDALEESAIELEANWGHIATPEMRDAIRALGDKQP